MAVVEDERVAQGDRLVEPGTLVGQAVEQRVVEIEGLAEVGEQLTAFLLGDPRRSRAGAGGAGRPGWRMGGWLGSRSDSLLVCVDGVLYTHQVSLLAQRRGAATKSAASVSIGHHVRVWSVLPNYGLNNSQ